MRAAAIPSPALPGLIDAARRRWHESPFEFLASGALILILAFLAVRALGWAVADAVFEPDAGACRRAAGACWGAVVDRARLILLGRFPASESWRPILGSAVLLSALIAVSSRILPGRAGLLVLAASLGMFVVLMRGGVAGLGIVGTDLWGGLPLTLFLSTAACFLGMPLGVLLAIGRRSELPLVRWGSVAYIEGIRAIPLITLLFFGAFVLPLLLPPSIKIDMALRIVICLVAFEAAYFAEVVRGGLQAVPAGQTEAARALGLGRYRTLRLVVLPQALRLVIAPTINNVIGVIKNTSLVAVVNVYDLTGSLKLASADPEWKPYFVELYLFVSAVYLALGIGLSQYGRHLERVYAVAGAKSPASAKTPE